MAKRARENTPAQNHVRGFLTRHSYLFFSFAPSRLRGNIFQNWDYQHQQQRRFIGNLTFAINYHFGKLDVFGYHLFNIAIHCAAALLMYRFVMLLFSTPVMRRNDMFSSGRLIALFCGLVFVSHPLQTQAVTYIVQRFASLASLFYVASACFFLEARMSHGIRRYLFILGRCSTALLGIFTKEILITLPFALILIEMFFFSVETLHATSLLTGLPSLLKSRKFLYLLIPALLFLLIVPFFFHSVYRIFSLR